MDATFSVPAPANVATLTPFEVEATVVAASVPTVVEAYVPTVVLPPTVDEAEVLVPLAAHVPLAPVVCVKLKP
jgi:hypothetical protein